MDDDDDDDINDNNGIRGWYLLIWGYKIILNATKERKKKSIYPAPEFKYIITVFYTASDREFRPSPEINVYGLTTSRGSTLRWIVWMLYGKRRGSETSTERERIVFTDCAPRRRHRARVAKERGCRGRYGAPTTSCDRNAPHRPIGRETTLTSPPTRLDVVGGAVYMYTK